MRAEEPRQLEPPPRPITAAEAKKVRGPRSVPAPAKAVAEKKAVAKKGPDDAAVAIKVQPLVATDPKQVLEQQRLKKKSLEAALLKVEASRDRVKVDLATQRDYIKAKEAEESKLYDDIFSAREAAKKAAADGNDQEKRRFDQAARLGQDKLGLASKALLEAQARIDRVYKKLEEMEADEQRRHAEVSALTAEISALELASAFLRPKKVLARYPLEFQVLPIALNDPCPFCERYFVDTCCVPLFCGCLAHPHCMFEAVFSQDARCRRCERGMTGGWLGQWGFDLDSKAAEELRLTEEILLAEPASPRAGSKRPAAPLWPRFRGRRPRATKVCCPSTHLPFLVAYYVVTSAFFFFLILVCWQQLQRDDCPHSDTLT